MLHSIWLARTFHLAEAELAARLTVTVAVLPEVAPTSRYMWWPVEVPHTAGYEVVTELSADNVAWMESVQAPLEAVCPNSKVWKSSLTWQMLSLSLVTL